MMNPWLQVALGGAVGSLARFGIGWRHGWDGQGWPLHRLAANLPGGLAPGVLFVTLATRGREDFPPLLLVGLLGGFAIFSAFSLDAWQMTERGAPGMAAACAALSVLGSVMALGALPGRLLT